jgi:site-specific DNA recombinase
MNRTKLVVAYVRVSTSEQEKNGYGIRIQLRDVRAFAQRNKLSVDRFYIERAETGVLEQRTQLQKLLRACEGGDIGTLIIPATHRLSRDVRIAENLFWQFEKVGVEVLIADMPSYSSSDRKAVFFRQIREAIAEEDRKDIIEKLWKGRRERVRNGKPAGGMVPYGYRRRKNSFVPHPVESQIVKCIFEKVKLGNSGSDIAADLNRRGYRRRNGKEWTRQQVLAIARRLELYTEGKFHYGSISAINQKLVLIGA